MKRRSLGGLAALVFLVLAPFGAASAQTTRSVCTETASPCAGTPFAQVTEGAPAAESTQARAPLPRTGVDTEQLLMISIAALGIGCLVLLVVEAREGSYALESGRDRVRVTQ